MLENEFIIQKNKNGISYLQFKKLLEYPELKHMYVLKNGNMNFKKVENIESLEKTYEKVCTLEGMNYKNVIRPTQNHTDEIKCVYKKIGEGPDLYLPEYENVDGLLTDKSGFVLSTTNADCNLILLYDTKHKVIGNIHSGWKGTFKKIVLKAVQKMQKEYNSNPQDIIAALAPSIGKCCFEVDEDVAKPCAELFGYTNKLEEIITKKKDKYHIDTVLINKLLLEEAGLKKENIIASNICSKCHSEEVHSRRAEGPNYGVGTLLVSK